MNMKKVRIGMTDRYERTVGKRGQVTIPKAIRERHGLSDGAEVTITTTDGGILISPPTDDATLAEGYRATAERARRLAAEAETTGTEAADRLGDVPAWDGDE